MNNMIFLNTFTSAGFTIQQLKVNVLNYLSFSKLVQLVRNI